MDRDTLRAIEWDCAKVVQSFYACLDEKRYDDLGDLFAPDGVWNRLGKDLVGPEGIKQAMAGRHDWVTAHVLTNLMVEPVSEGEARTRQYVTLYRHEDVPANAGPLPVVMPIAVLCHRDTLVRIGADWRFKRKSSRAIMADPTRVTHYKPVAAPAA